MKSLQASPKTDAGFMLSNVLQSNMVIQQNNFMVVLHVPKTEKGNYKPHQLISEANHQQADAVITKVLKQPFKK